MEKADSSPQDKLPFVSVVIPVYNEESFIANLLDELLELNYPEALIEFLVVDGRSKDKTKEIIQSYEEKHPRIRLVDNPGRIVSSGLNIALDQARGEIIVRMDGHCEYPRDYILQVVGLISANQADNVGGVLVPSGKNFTSRAIAAAYHSPIGVGTGLRGYQDESELKEVDTVHGGCWRKERLKEIGGFDEEMVRNQDDELNFRITKLGGRILQNRGLKCTYWVRDSFQKLFMQFAQYGYWKVKVVQKHPMQSSFRHYIPVLFVAGVVCGAVLSCLVPLFLWVYLLGLGLYASCISLIGLFQAFEFGIRLWPGITFSLLIMHLAYGWGFLMGLLKKVFGRMPTDRIFEFVTR